jgi:hypothetical protein
MVAVPLNELVLGAASVADDLGFVALADVATAWAGTQALVIGGHMVQMRVGALADLTCWGSPLPERLALA